jgi:flagellar basal body-associated protein FliL
MTLIFPIMRKKINCLFVILVIVVAVFGVVVVVVLVLLLLHHRIKHDKGSQKAFNIFHTYITVQNSILK